MSVLFRHLNVLSQIWRDSYLWPWLSAVLVLSLNTARYYHLVINTGVYTVPCSSVRFSFWPSHFLLTNCFCTWKCFFNCTDRHETLRIVFSRFYGLSKKRYFCCVFAYMRMEKAPWAHHVQPSVCSYAPNRSGANFKGWFLRTWRPHNCNLNSKSYPSVWLYVPLTLSLQCSRV